MSLDQPGVTGLCGSYEPTDDEQRVVDEHGHQFIKTEPMDPPTWEPLPHAYRGPISEVGDSGWKCDLCGLAESDDVHHYGDTNGGDE